MFLYFSLGLIPLPPGGRGAGRVLPLLGSHTLKSRKEGVLGTALETGSCSSGEIKTEGVVLETSRVNPSWGVGPAGSSPSSAPIPCGDNKGRGRVNCKIPIVRGLI